MLWKSFPIQGSHNSLVTWWSPTDLLITQWILIALRCFWYHLKGLLKAFGSHLYHWNWSSIPGVMVQMKFVTLFSLLVRASLRSYLVFGKLWRYSCSFLPALCRFFSGSHVLSPWLYPFHLTRNSFFPCLCCESRIFSISYSSWPYIKVSGGGVDFCPQMVDLEYCANLLAWKTRCSADRKSTRLNSSHV